jgi:DNA-binding LacI/PurR family transcriptional regulator
VTYRIRDVAEQAGVSKTTVSRVLNKSRLVDPETRRRVLETARKLNYYRNAHAQRLARGRSDIFGLIISDIENPVFPEMIKSFETAAAEKGYDLLLCTTNYNAEKTEAAVRKMIENRVRGVAVMTSGVTKDIVEQLAARQIAVVLLDLDLTRRYISNIRVDYSGGVRQALDHLFDLGHKGVAFVAGPDLRRSAERYRQAVVDAIADRGMTLEIVVECDQTLEGGIHATQTILRSSKLPTAILCINDLTAIGTTAALREAGLRVPQDVSVIGSEDLYFASFVNPPLTSVRLDRKTLGSLAFEILQSLFRSKHLGTESVFETQLVVRQSTGPAKIPSVGVSTGRL